MRKVAGRAITRRVAKMITVAGSVAAILLGMAGFALPAGAGTARPSYDVRQILSGQSLHHWYTKSGSSGWHWERLTQPDDITTAGGYLFTGFQNGVGPQGQASTDGNRDSTIVEFTRTGKVVRQWDVRGKCDGLTANPATGAVIATVNEDANSSLYRIDPWSGQVGHYSYNKPLPHHGGTDAISFSNGQMLISASAPGTTGAAAPNPAYPAVYSVTLSPGHVAYIHALFSDESMATAASGPHAWKRVKLGLTDPDSNEVVPWSAPRFAGDFMLTSQGDKEQIYVHRAGRGDPLRRGQRPRHLPGPWVPAELPGPAEHVQRPDHPRLDPRRQPRTGRNDLRRQLSHPSRHRAWPRFRARTMICSPRCPRIGRVAGRRRRRRLSGGLRERGRSRWHFGSFRRGSKCHRAP